MGDTFYIMLVIQVIINQHIHTHTHTCTNLIILIKYIYKIDYELDFGPFILTFWFIKKILFKNKFPCYLLFYINILYL